ncbi:MAG: ribonuclease P protein component [Gammaproteobacteria bacterium]|nr:ribonuclease P protein component [Gammaproteobacteria bacterium]
MDRRFARKRRLLKAADYRAVFVAGHACSSEYFTLLGRLNEQSVGRVGLAVAKRRIARATRRNAVKRIVRESFRHHQHELAALDIVVIANTAAEIGDHKRVRKSLDAQWAKLAKLVRRKNPAGALTDG